MRTKANLVFLACNYSNTKVKASFDHLKARWEDQFPIRVCLLDRENGPGTPDIWGTVKTTIADASLAIFDVSAFRPNVVLELGFALATKEPESIVITFDERQPRNGDSPDWALSDISQLKQIRYRVIKTLAAKLDEQVEKVEIVRRFRAFERAAIRASGPDVGRKYVEQGLRILQGLRDQKSLSGEQIEEMVKGSCVRVPRLTQLLKDHQLARRGQGAGSGWWRLDDE